MENFTFSFAQKIITERGVEVSSAWLKTVFYLKEHLDVSCLVISNTITKHFYTSIIMDSHPKPGFSITVCHRGPSSLPLSLQTLPLRSAHCSDSGDIIASHADDLTIVSQQPHVDTSVRNLQTYIHQLEAWLTSNRMSELAPKSSITLVTPYNNTDYSLRLPKPVVLLSKYFGITLDRVQTFQHNVAIVTSSAKNLMSIPIANLHPETKSFTSRTALRWVSRSSLCPR